MNVKIQSIHFDADKKLVDFVTERVKRLDTFHDGIVGSEVILRLDKSSDTENKLAEIKLLVPGNDLFAKKQCKTFEEAVDSAVEAIKKQLTRQKEKLRGI